jgi:replicative superfamily II helicase
MKAMSSTFYAQKHHSIRFLAISATVPNIKDIAYWLQNEDGTPATVREFGDEYRPVQLHRLVIDYPMSGNMYMFDKFLDAKLFEIIGEYSAGKPTLVFCATRKSVATAAETLMKECFRIDSNYGHHHPFTKTINQYNGLLSLKAKLIDKKLAGKPKLISTNIIKNIKYKIL